MEKEIIRTKLKECFERCAMGRIQLRKCVINAMDAGFPKEV